MSENKGSKCATVSSLCTIEHSPSAWAGFAPKLTVTLTIAKTKLCLTPHSGSSSYTPGRPSTATRSLANALHCGVAVTGLSARPLQMSPWTELHAFALSVLSKVDLNTQRLLWHLEQFPDACCGCCGSCSCSCCCRFLLADAGTWSPAACRCELTAEPKSQNIVTVIIHFRHFLHPCSRILT